jgi:hypothetical protein
MNTLNLYICSSNGYSCLLALGDVEEAQQIFEMCLKSNHLSNLDHKIVEEASDHKHAQPNYKSHSIL